jgi:hypothetical protein
MQMPSLLWRRHPLKINDWLVERLSRDRVARLQVLVKELPHYRFVDLYRAIEHYCGLRRKLAYIATEHPEDLSTILHTAQTHFPRRIKPASRLAWPSGPGEEEVLPVDAFWIVGAPDDVGKDPVLVRLRYDTYRDRAFLEVASDVHAVAERCVDMVTARSVGASIYRNHVIELSFESAIKDEYGDIERPDRLRILFRRHESVEDADLIIDPELYEVLWRNLIDLHVRRELLRSYQVPVRRGVLLYGPPGTGKTFTCRYVCSKLPDATKIIVTGTALPQVKSVFSLARMLQPALVILEDVDLVFMAREMNPYGSVLGDLLDQMDGLRPYEDINFLLTTNSIDRIEAAIRERPGRISQCVYLGAPNHELRKRYLAHYLVAYEVAEIDIEELVHMSGGATQAFLKEWVHRAVQIATERVRTEGEKLYLKMEDFRRAMQEMRGFGDEAGRIIGFYA